MNKQDIQDPGARSAEITRQYFAFIDKHVEDVVNGNVQAFMELNQIAAALFVSHQHLTDTVQKATGSHPCYFYDLKIIEQAKKKLAEGMLTIAEIARILTYDPSNFSKFFKKFTGRTPKQWRIQNSSKQEKPKSSPLPRN